MNYNFFNDLLLRKKIEEFKKDKNALKFADWVNANVDPDFLVYKQTDEIKLSLSKGGR